MSDNYYTVNNPHNEQALNKTSIRKAEHQFWENILPDEDTDLEFSVTSLATTTGESRDRIRTLIMAFYQLSELPRLEALQGQLHHLSLHHLIAITNALFGLDPQHLEVVDEHLTNYLTPSAPNQTMPTVWAIRNKIKSIRNMIRNPRATNLSEPKDFSVSVGSDGTADLYATVSDLEGNIIEGAVKKHATATGKTQAEAFTDLILGNLKLKVVVNLYTAKDLAEAPVWASGVGWLDTCTGKEWTDRATNFRDMDTVMGAHTEAHDATPDIAAGLNGRDDTCAAPGCNVKGVSCDCDHRVNHADGGGTCLHNCKKLCRHHHNPKTAGRVKYLMDPITGITIWMLEDGSWSVTVPEGPLTPQSAMWAQTISQYRVAHRERWATEAKKEYAVQQDEPPY